MQLDIKFHEPIRLSMPYTEEYTAAHRKRLKQLGITPDVDNGIPVWRVIWRPFLTQPIPYTKQNGSPGLKYKAGNVRTERYPIVGDTTEEEAFRQAAVTAAAAYRKPMASIMPIVDWEGLAALKKVKLRNEYAKPALNGGIEKAKKLFEKGWGLRQVANELGISHSTACRWRQKINKQAKESAPQE